MRTQKSRSRGKGRHNNNNNNNRGANVVNRVFDSSGPQGKVRGTPQQIIDKYQQLHRDAQLNGDRVDAENFAQHAEHYTRLLSEAMKEQEARQKEQDARREAQEAQHRERQREREEQHAARQDQNNAAQGNAQNGGPNTAQNAGNPSDQNNDRHDAQADDRNASADQNAQDNRPNQRRRRAPQPASDPGSADQPDVIDLNTADEGGSSLVETVEATPKPARKPRTRKPRVKPDDAAKDKPETPAAE